MRFSLKWTLAGMAYVAVAAAAFGTNQWYFADALSVLSLLLLVYVALVAYLAQGARRLAAAGFVLSGLGFLLWLAVGGESAPVTRVLAACGIDPSSRPSSSIFKQLVVTVTSLPESAESVVYYTDAKEGSGFNTPSSTALISR